MNRAEDGCVTICSYGWEQLSDGRWQVWIGCQSEDQLLDLPRDLLLNYKEFHRCGFDVARQLARYRSGWEELTAAARISSSAVV